jgi:glycopeptide antibiotics resistance protein
VPDALLVAGRPELLLNVAMVVPVPLLASFAWQGLTWRDWTAYGFAASVLVEAVQGLLLPSRTSSYVDVVANTLGAAVGGLVALLVARWRARERQPVAS